MGDNALKGHTTKLTDGDFLLSPSLTNPYEGLHGNGIILLEDGATSTSGLRNTPASLPGAITNTVNVLTIKSGYAVIDGMVVNFGGGYTSNTPDDYTLQLKQASIEGSNTALTSGQSVLLVVYVCSNGATGTESQGNFIQVEMGTPVSSGYPVTPEDFLSDPLLSLSSKQSTVLAVLKCVHEGSLGTNNDLKLTVSEIHDRRTYIRNTPLYLPPMTKDVVGTFTNRINAHGDLDGMHGGTPENGSLSGSPFGALWMSKNLANEAILYFSGEQASARHTWRLGPDIATTYAGSSNQTFRMDTTNIWHITPGTNNLQVNPAGTFPVSHTIHIYNFDNSNAIVFNGTTDGNSGTASFTISNNSSAILAMGDDDEWKQIFVSTNVTSTAHGAATRIQISNGSGSHTSDAGLTYNAGTDILTVTGKAAISGLVQDPTGVELTAVSSNPGSTAGDTLWMKSTDSNRLYQGSAKILNDGDTVGVTVLTGLTDTPANYSGAANKFLQVNSTPNAIIFDTLASGDLPTNLNTITQIGPAGTLTVNQDLTITGNLIVSGATTTLNVGEIDVEDININLGNGAGDDSVVTGGGITLESTDSNKTILWSNPNDAWTFNQHIFPSADSTFNLGATGTRFANGYFDALNITALTTAGITSTGNSTFDGTTLVVDGTNNRVGVKHGGPTATFQIENIGMEYKSGAVDPAASGTPVNIALFDATKFRGGELLFEAINVDNSRYEVSKCVFSHNGTTAYITTYGTVRSDTGVNACTLAADISGGNVRVNITTPASENGDEYIFHVGWKGFVIPA